MIENQKKLPIGIDSFQKIRKENFYYVDKTRLIEELLNDWGEVNLFTRPRRFGKSLNMDMLKSFFEIGTDFSAFEGLAIRKQTELCNKYMGQYPVISLSFKDVGGADYTSACQTLSTIISDEAGRICRNYGLLSSDKLLESDKVRLNSILEGDYHLYSDITNSLKLLSQLLCVHCGKNVILLLDEYDVPLDKAYQNGYYEQMSDTIRDLLSMALKSNRYLHFAVLTGCLRIAKESIFTGLNNFVVNSISDVEFAEYFGFTDIEVKNMLQYYGLDSLYETIKEWYDGYHFGQTDVYCPWDVINYLRKLRTAKNAQPELYWVNSSSNSIIRNMLNNATQTTKSQIEMLISGETVKKKIMPELTYKDLDNEDITIRETYLWSVLYATGYLTGTEQMANGLTALKIPNHEVQEIYTEKIQNWFQANIKSNMERWKKFCIAVKTGDTENFQSLFNQCMGDSISIRDTFSKKERKENFYHGMLLGILQCEGNWSVKSNQESGIGYSDILLEIPTEKIGCVIEVKYAEKGRFDEACLLALKQIKENNYTDLLKKEGLDIIHIYGVACYKKSCQIIYERYTKT